MIFKSFFIVLIICWSSVIFAEINNKQALTLEHCIRTALEKHQSLSISAANVAMAEAMYQQAMSAYWPKIAADVNAQRADQDRTFSIQGDLELPQGMANALTSLSAINAQNRGASPQALQQILANPISTLPINLDVKLFDRDTLTSSLNLTYPIFTGLKREALVAQTRKGIQAAEQGQRKTNLEVIRDVKKYYYAAQFATQMELLTEDTLERFKALEDLTERLYQNGSLKVKKTDYLRIKTTTAMTRTVLSEARYAREMAYEALGNAMGQEWQANQSIVEAETSPQLSEGLHQLLESAQNFNPDIQQLKLAVQISEDQITEARSGYFPMIGFHASVYDVQSDFKSGLTNATNRDGWTIGIGMQWNLFDGFQTAGRVNQAQAQQRKLQSQQVLLDQAIALQVKQQFLSIKSSYGQTKDSSEAVGFASENRKLHVRAYQDELVETKDVIEAQVLETFAQASQYRAHYALEMGLLSLEFLIGQNVNPE
jgi:outer membrane protein TolC